MEVLIIQVLLHYHLKGTDLLSIGNILKIFLFRDANVSLYLAIYIVKYYVYMGISNHLQLLCL